MIQKLREAFTHDGTNVKDLFKLLPTMVTLKKRLIKSNYKLDFIKEENRWYVDLPEWPLDRTHLLMVEGADDFLDEIAATENLLNGSVSIRATPIPMMKELLKKMKYL